MKILIKSAEVVDPAATYHRQKVNIMVEDGIIKKISAEDIAADVIIEGKNLKVSCGWIDMRVSTGDPGFEHKEDIQSINRSAAFGGFTEVVCMPHTKPVIQSKDVLGYIKSRCREQLVEVHAAAAVTINREGKELSEMMDLHHAGAIAFTDGDKPVWHTDVLLKALQYLQSFDGLLINHAEELHLTHAGQMNESIESTLLGLKGMPMLAEELMIARDIDILKYTGGKIHFSHVSSPKSIELIKQARNLGLSVTCDVAAYQLVLDDSLMKSFDTNLKVNPPLRAKQDIEALWTALKDGIIDVVVSDHIPQDEESKNLEFDLAEFGMIGLETVFALLRTYGETKISMEEIVNKLSYAPRKILKLTLPQIAEGAQANLTVFDPDAEWVYQARDIRSKSRNTPFTGWKFKGKVIAVFNKGKYILN
jgi:dihydroorotase